MSHHLTSQTQALSAVWSMPVHANYSNFLIWSYIDCVWMWTRDSCFSVTLCNHNKGSLLPWLPAVHPFAKRVRQAAGLLVYQGLFLTLFPSCRHSTGLSLPFYTTALFSQASSTPTFCLHLSVFSFSPFICTPPLSSWLGMFVSQWVPNETLSKVTSVECYS